MYVGSVVPGGGAFEVAAYSTLTSSEFMKTVPGRAKYGVKVGHAFEWVCLYCVAMVTVGVCGGPIGNTQDVGS